LSKLTEKLNSIFAKHKGDAGKQTEAAMKATGQKASTVRIYLWRWRHTGDAAKGVYPKKPKGWKSDIWNKGKERKSAHVKAPKKKREPRKQRVRRLHSEELERQSKAAEQQAAPPAGATSFFS